MKTKIEVKRMLVNDSMEALEYLDSLDGIDDSSTIHNNIIIVQSELKVIENRNNSGVISIDEYTRLMSKVRLNILNILDQIPSYFFEEKTADLEHSALNTNASELEGQTRNNKDQIFLEVLSLIRQLSEIRIKEFHAHNIENSAVLYSQYNTDRHLLLNQIIKLVEIHHFVLSSAEYRVIGESFQTVFDNIRAEEYYKKAINTIDEYTDSTNSKIVAMRVYAAFLYNINKPIDGANMFRAALLNNNNDEANQHNGYTSQRKFTTEAQMNMVDSAIAAFKEARTYYFQIKNPMMRQTCLMNLDSDWKLSPLAGQYAFPD